MTRPAPGDLGFAYCANVAARGVDRDDHPNHRRAGGHATRAEAARAWDRLWQGENASLGGVLAVPGVERVEKVGVPMRVWRFRPETATFAQLIALSCRTFAPPQVALKSHHLVADPDHFAAGYDHLVPALGGGEQFGGEFVGHPDTTVTWHSRSAPANRGSRIPSHVSRRVCGIGALLYFSEILSFSLVRIGKVPRRGRVALRAEQRQPPVPISCPSRKALMTRASRSTVMTSLPVAGAASSSQNQSP